MNLTLHHINLSTDKVAEMESFYRDVLGLETAEDDLPALTNREDVYTGDVAFVSDGRIHNVVVSTIWSMAPKTEAPRASSIHILIRSPG